MASCWIWYSERRSRGKNILGDERLQNTKYLVSKCCLKQIPKVTSILVLDHLSESKTQLVNQRKVAFNPGTGTAHSPEIPCWDLKLIHVNKRAPLRQLQSYSINHPFNLWETSHGWEIGLFLWVLGANWFCYNRSTLYKVTQTVWSHEVIMYGYQPEKLLIHQITNIMPAQCICCDAVTYGGAFE